MAYDMGEEAKKDGQQQVNGNIIVKQVNFKKQKPMKMEK